MKKRHHSAAFIKRLERRVIGKALNPFDPAIFHTLSLVALFAWVGLGADALSSSAYGPAETFLTLQGHTHLSVFVAIASALTIFIISSSYSQIIELFPAGGGGYLVASKLLSPSLGMISGCALLIDYVLTITISIASGVDALFSFFPPEWRIFQLAFALVFVLILLILNLRGVKESIAILMPIFLLFVATHAIILLYAVATHAMDFPQVAGGIVTDFNDSLASVGFTGLLFLMLRSYSMGAGTYTGIEAVSNGVPILREPKVKTAKRTMRLMSASLMVMVLGLLLCYLLYNVTPREGKTLNAVLFEGVVAGWGDAGYYFVILALVSEAALLFIAAQTGFVDGPRVLASMALDRWFPVRLATLSDRLVTRKGILIMGGSAFLMMIITQGSVQFLVVLYSITVFLTFFLSQVGMVRYWWQQRALVKNWAKKFSINSLGMVLTFFILVTNIWFKFNVGGWITILITAALVGFVIMIKRHYDHVSHLVLKLDGRITCEGAGGVRKFADIPKRDPPAEADLSAKTAVVLVNGYNGLGLRTLEEMFRSPYGTYKNFIFIEVGVIDAGVFKGVSEMHHLKKRVEDEVERYVDYMRSCGYYAEGLSPVGVDAVEEIIKLAPGIIKRFPNATFIGGKIVLQDSTIFSRWLHNYTLQEVERRFCQMGVPYVEIPVGIN